MGEKHWTKRSKESGVFMDQKEEASSRACAGRVMDANSAQPWPEMDNTPSLLAYGNVTDAASMLCRDSLKSAKGGSRLVEHPGKRGLCASSDKRPPVAGLG